jgi:hypothetical protein
VASGICGDQQIKNTEETWGLKRHRWQALSATQDHSILIDQRHKCARASAT